MGSVSKIKTTRGGSMTNGVLLLFCIVVFSFAVLTLFFIEPHQEKKFDKQSVVKYNDNDY